MFVAISIHNQIEKIQFYLNRPQRFMGSDLWVYIHLHIIKERGVVCLDA